MQFNFLQEDLLEYISQEKPVRSQAPSSPKKIAPLQTSLLADLPPPIKKAASAPPATATPTSEKSAAAFKTIGEAAEILGVPAYVLRFWENQFPQIHPTKSRGGRRYYRPEDMEILTSIKTLLYKEGYTIKGARKAFAQMKHQDKELSLPAHTPKEAERNTKPVITPKQRSQLSAIRSEILNMQAQLATYLTPA